MQASTRVEFRSAQWGNPLYALTPHEGDRTSTMGIGCVCDVHPHVRYITRVTWFQVGQAFCQAGEREGEFRAI